MMSKNKVPNKDVVFFCLCVAEVFGLEALLGDKEIPFAQWIYTILLIKAVSSLRTNP